MSDDNTTDRSQFFYELTPDALLTACETFGKRATGFCYALNSLENRVYEVEFEDEIRVVAKFYRPTRWSRETIADEHRLLLALQEHEIPVCAPLLFPDGETLHTTPEGIHFALFPKVGGRNPDELSLPDFREVGALLGRIHNIASSLELSARPRLDVATYGRHALTLVEAHPKLEGSLRERYLQTANRFLELVEASGDVTGPFVVHSDCHRGNLLRGRDGWFFLDFDDAAHAHVAQDLWLLLPGTWDESPAEVEAIMTGYDRFRELPPVSSRLIESLRGLRYLRFTGWIAERWDDPAFSRAFPEWGTERYWQEQVSDLGEQIERVQSG